MLGCYSFPSHVLTHHPDVPTGIEIPTVLDSLRTELPDAKVTFAQGCDVTGPDTAGFEEAVARTAEADVCVAVLGDRAGLFGRGTSGEGCDATDLGLPGAQGELLDALIATGVPVVLVLLTGRPYALGRWHGRLGSRRPGLLPGGGRPGGRGRPVGPREPVGPSPRERPAGPRRPARTHPPPLGLAGEVSNLDPTPLYAFGHGRSYTTFAWEDGTGGAEPAEIGTDGSYDVSVTVRNTGEREGAEVVQLYLHDPVASVTRPDMRLIGYQRVAAAPGETARVTFRFHADLSSFTDRAGRRVVEPGALELRLAASSADVRHTACLTLTGPVRVLGTDRRLRCETEVSPNPSYGPVSRRRPTRTATGAPPGSPNSPSGSGSSGSSASYGASHQVEDEDPVLGSAQGLPAQRLAGQLLGACPGQQLLAAPGNGPRLPHQGDCHG
ncbi:hypothetical protein SPURM210S_06363 [Streptomyces purpurascens]